MEQTADSALVLWERACVYSVGSVEKKKKKENVLGNMSNFTVQLYLITLWPVCDLIETLVTLLPAVAG